MAGPWTQKYYITETVSEEGDPSSRRRPVGSGQERAGSKSSTGATRALEMREGRARARSNVDHGGAHPGVLWVRCGTLNGRKNKMMKPAMKFWTVPLET